MLTRRRANGNRWHRYFVGPFLNIEPGFRLRSMLVRDL
jgi:hypothetical protein